MQLFSHFIEGPCLWSVSYCTAVVFMEQTMLPGISYVVLLQVNYDYRKGRHLVVNDNAAVIKQM